MQGRGLLWACLAGLCLGVGGGAVWAWAAEPPPVGVEGREVDPVAQTFHMPEVPLGGYVAPATATPSHPAESAWQDLWELLMWQMSMPLGPAVPESDNSIFI